MNTPPAPDEGGLAGNGHEFGRAASGDVTGIRSADAQANSDHGCLNGEDDQRAEDGGQKAELGGRNGPSVHASSVSGLPLHSHIAQPTSHNPQLLSPSSNNSLLLVNGPLAPNWGWRKWGVLPRLENAELTGVNPPTIQRLELWVRQQVHVIGRPEWIFVKLHTHGCMPENRDMLLGGTMRQFHLDMQAWCRDNNIKLHYVTAREMYNIARAAEDGHSGDPAQYRDHEIAPPPVREERGS